MRSISASERWMSQNSFLTRSLSDLNQMSTESDCKSGGGGGVLDQWLGIGVPLRVSNPDPV